MKNKIYVGNLPFSFTDENLKELFSTYGEISEASVIIDKRSGRSKGFGFVSFTNESEAEKAINEMNGKEVEGREIRVSAAKPMEPNSNSGFRRHGNFRRNREF